MLFLSHEITTGRDSECLHNKWLIWNAVWSNQSIAAPAECASSYSIIPSPHTKHLIKNQPGFGSFFLSGRLYRMGFIFRSITLSLCLSNFGSLGTLSCPEQIHTAYGAALVPVDVDGGFPVIILLATSPPYWPRSTIIIGNSQRVSKAGEYLALQNKFDTLCSNLEFRYLYFILKVNYIAQCTRAKLYGIYSQSICAVVVDNVLQLSRS